jgi:hypothetical protein
MDGWNGLLRRLPELILSACSCSLRAGVCRQSASVIAEGDGLDAPQVYGEPSSDELVVCLTLRRTAGTSSIRSGEQALMKLSGLPCVKKFVSDATSYRLFIAIELPDAVKAELGRVQRELRGELPSHSASWTKLDNLHLTLRFLGDVEANRVSELRSVLRDSVAGAG